MVTLEGINAKLQRVQDQIEQLSRDIASSCEDQRSLFSEELRLDIKWTHCRCQNNGKISKIIESHRHSFSRNRPQPALHNRDSGEVVGDYRNGYNELIHRKELVPSGTVSDKHLHT